MGAMKKIEAVVKPFKSEPVREALMAAGFDPEVMPANCLRDVAFLSAIDAYLRVLRDTFASRFASFAHVEQALITAQIGAELKVIDDQRLKSSKTVANDDRAAATAMREVADSVQG